MENELWGMPLYWYIFAGYVLFYQGIWSLIAGNFIIAFTGCRHKVKYYLIYLLLGLFIHFVLRRYDCSEVTLLAITIFLSFVYVKFLLEQTVLLSVITVLLVSVFQQLSWGIVAPVNHLLFNQPLTYINQLIFMMISMMLALSINAGLYYCIWKKIKFKSLNLNRYAYTIIIPLLLIILSWQMSQNQAITKADGELIETISSQSFIEECQMSLISLIEAICILSILFALQKLIVFYRLENEQAILRQQLSAQQNYVEEVTLRIRQTRALRHDLRNHFSILQHLLADEDLRTASAYLEKCNQVIADISFTYHTGNVVLDALFNQKLNIARQADIEVECEVNIPNFLKVDDFDLCIIFANAIDNAVKACRQVAKEERYIKLSTNLNGGFLMIEVNNRYTPEGKQCGGFGIGLPNIKSVAKKYQGIVEITTTPDCFCLTILLIVS